MRKTIARAFGIAAVGAVGLLGLALPASATPGWTMHCEGTTAVYKGPNGSYMRAENSENCGGTPGNQQPR